MVNRQMIASAAAVIAVVGGGYLLVRSPAARRFLGPVADRGGPPNVVLFTIDTLRADRLGCYGSTTTKTPHIDALAREGTLFAQAATPMPITRPAHSSIFTSLYPREHGVLHNGQHLGPDPPTLAERFRAADYRTGAFVGVRLLDEESGLGRGFDTFDVPRRWRLRDANRVVPRAIDWLDAGDGRRPFFLWVHLFDPHQPYAPTRRFRPTAPRRVLKRASWIDWNILIALADRTGGDLAPEFYDWALALYGGEVESVDHWVGVLLDALDDRGLLDGTVIAFTADHGECFEHGIFFEHYNCLYEGATHVPLVLRYPAAVPRGVRDQRVVDHVDLAPTLLALATLPVPPTFRGAPLFSASERTPKAYAILERPRPPALRMEARVQRQVYLQSVKGEPVRPHIYSDIQLGLRSAEWKYIATHDHQELYHLPTDPGEQHDVAAERPEVIARLRPVLDRYAADHPVPEHPEPEPMSDALRDTLRALGYLP